MSGREEGIPDEELELYINDDTNHFQQLLDSISAGWKANELKHLVLKWNIDPRAADDKKEAVIRKALQQVERLGLLKENSRLKSITLSVGEGMFLTSKDNLEYFDQKAQKENLLRASAAFQEALAKLPFKLDVYAEGWGW